MLILKAFWFLLPAAFANMTPVFARYWFSNWNLPVDLNRSFFGRALFGQNKTYRGIVCGTAAGALIFAIQRELGNQFLFLKTIEVFDYSSAHVLFGGVLGFGAMLGDLIKSFFKRRLHIEPGAPWIPYDQIDWIAGSIVVTYTVYSLPAAVFIASFAIGLCLHFAGKYLGFRLNVNSEPI